MLHDDGSLVIIDDINANLDSAKSKTVSFLDMYTSVAASLSLPFYPAKLMYSNSGVCSIMKLSSP
jgi:hypothetical protein